MKPRNLGIKKKRIVFTFEPDPDVAQMVKRATNAGLELKEIMNEALKDCGPKVIKGLAKKRSESLQSLSFNQPDSPLGWLQAA